MPSLSTTANFLLYLKTPSRVWPIRRDLVHFKTTPEILVQIESHAGTTTTLEEVSHIKSVCFSVASSSLDSRRVAAIFHFLLLFSFSLSLSHLSSSHSPSRASGTTWTAWTHLWPAPCCSRSSSIPAGLDAARKCQRNFLKIPSLFANIKLRLNLAQPWVLIFLSGGSFLGLCVKFTFVFRRHSS